jgi:hypothetical protein
MIMPDLKMDIPNPESEIDELDTVTILNSDNDFPFDMDLQDIS